MYPTPVVKNSSWHEGPIGSMISGASSVCQPLLDTNFALGNYGNNHKMFSNEFFSGNIEPSCAPSLLSLTPAVPEETGLSLTGQASSICSAQSFVPRLHHYNDLGMQNKAAIPNLVTDGSNNSNLLCIQQMFH